jgi:hypothetical protein
MNYSPGGVKKNKRKEDWSAAGTGSGAQEENVPVDYYEVRLTVILFHLFSPLQSIHIGIIAFER